MIVNVTYALLFLICSYIIGYALLVYLRFEDKYKLSTTQLLAAPIGVAINALISALVYFDLKLSISVVRIAILLVSLICLIYVLVKKQFTRKNIIGLISMISLFFLMFLGGAARGDKYYVYKGNLYDKDIYICEVAYMSGYNADYGRTEMKTREWKDPVLKRGYQIIRIDRPCAPLLCSVIADGGNIYFVGFLFCDLMWSIIIGPVMCMAECLHPGGRNWKYFLYGLPYLLGYFCQIQNDIDAWSQLTAAAVVIAFTCIWMIKLKSVIYDGDRYDIGFIMFMVLTGAGMLLIYPEATLVVGFIIALITLYYMLVIRDRQVLVRVLFTLIIPVGMIGLSCLVHLGTMKFAVSELGGSSDAQRQAQAAYFAASWDGYHELVYSGRTAWLIKKALTIIPCVFGMYHLTPIYSGIHFILIAVWMMLMGILSIGVIGLILQSVFRMVDRTGGSDDFYQKAYGSGAIFSICLFLVFIVRGENWTAFKFLLYVSIFIYLLLAMPVMEYLSRRNASPASGEASVRSRYIKCFLLATSAVFVLSQLGLAGLRVERIITEPDGILEMGNYPSYMDCDVKREMPFGFDASEYRDSGVVALDVWPESYRKYIMSNLTYEGITYYSVSDFPIETRSGEIIDEVRPGDTLIVAP